MSNATFGPAGKPVLPTDFIKTRRAAQIIGVHEHTLERWRLHGEGPAFYLRNGYYTYRVQDVLDWLEQYRVDPARKTEGGA